MSIMMEVCHRLLATGLCFIGILAACRAQVTSPCHASWVSRGSSCYLFHTHSMWNWIESQEFCRTHNAHLVTIETVEENNFLKQLVKTTVDNNDDIDEENVWIGAMDDQTEDVWRWIGTDAKVSYMDWYPGEPNSHPLDEVEDCLVMWAGYDYQWADLDCHEKSYYICEKASETATIIG